MCVSLPSFPRMNENIVVNVLPQWEGGRDDALDYRRRSFRTRYFISEAIFLSLPKMLIPLSHLTETQGLQLTPAFGLRLE